MYNITYRKNNRDVEEYSYSSSTSHKLLRKRVKSNLKKNKYDYAKIEYGTNTFYIYSKEYNKNHKLK